jgi:transaldolase
MSHTLLHRLYEEQDQAPWLDNISRDMIKSGQLKSLIAEGIVGVTSNPTIFEKAMASGNAYDEAISKYISNGGDSSGLFFSLMVDDIGQAADIFRSVYDNTKGKDGFISIEVTPDLAKDTQGSIDQALVFNSQLDRPNILVKVPATKEGIPAIEELIYQGVSINVTLIFSLQRYQEVIDAYINGIERRVNEGKPVDKIASVASFFISRVDTNIDKKLQALIDKADGDDAKHNLQGLMGKAAVANAKLAYQLFLQNFSGERWDKLAAAGANVQRPLWASTSTKNPAYPDTLYVDDLIGPDTVNTMPDATIKAFSDHGTVARTIDQNVDQAKADLQALADAGISMDQVTQELEDEGVASFAKSYESLSASLNNKVAELEKNQSQTGSVDLEPISSAS